MKGSSEVHDEATTGVIEWDDDLPVLLLLIWVFTMLLRSNRALPSETVSIRIVIRSCVTPPSLLLFSDNVAINGRHLAITVAFFFSSADGVSSTSPPYLGSFFPAPLTSPEKNWRRTASVQSVATNG